MGKATALGAAILVVLFAVPVPEIAVLSPVAAAVTAAWVAPSRRKVAAGTSMALAATALSLAVSGVFQALGGHGDFDGWRGAQLLATLTLAWTLPACLVTAVIAGALSTTFGRDGDWP